MTGFLRDVLRWRQKFFLRFSTLSSVLSLGLFVSTLLVSSVAWARCTEPTWGCAYANFAEGDLDSGILAQSQGDIDTQFGGSSTPIISRKDKDTKEAEAGRKYLESLLGKEEILRRANKGECKFIYKSLTPFCLKMSNALKRVRNNEDQKESLCQEVRQIKKQKSDLTHELLGEFLVTACPVAAPIGPCSPTEDTLGRVASTVQESQKIVEKAGSFSQADVSSAMDFALSILRADESKCLKGVGIFRLSGTDESIKEVLKNPRIASKVLKMGDCDTAAAVLKRLLAQYSPFEKVLGVPTSAKANIKLFHETFLPIVEDEEKANKLSTEKVKELGQVLLESLNPESRDRLFKVLNIFGDAILYKEQTKMDLKNLAIVLAPSLGDPDPSKYLENMSNQSQLEKVAALLLQHRGELESVIARSLVRSKALSSLPVTKGRTPAVLPGSESRDDDKDPTRRFQGLGEIQLKFRPNYVRSESSVLQAYEVKHRSGTVLNCENLSYVDESREIPPSATESKRLTQKKFEFKSHYVCHSADGTQVKLQANEIEGVREYFPRE